MGKRDSKDNQSRRDASTSGFTLVEISLAIGILVLLSGLLIALGTSTTRSLNLIQAETTTQDNSRAVMLRIVRELRQASSATVSIQDAGGNPVPPGTAGVILSYSIITDLDGNGWPVDSSGDLELSPLRTIQVDVGDLNSDDVESQLIRWEGDPGSEEVMVLGNFINNGDIEFVSTGTDSVVVTLRSTKTPGFNREPISTVLSETITPRD